MLKSLFNKFRNKKEYNNSDVLISEKKNDSLTLEQYVSQINSSINKFLKYPSYDDLNNKNIKVSFYIDDLFKNNFLVKDFIYGLKDANTLFKDTFNTSLRYTAKQIPVLHSANYASEGLSVKEGNLFKEKVQFDYSVSGAIKIYLTKIPFVKISNGPKQTSGIAAVGLPYAVIDGVVSPKEFTLILAHELSHCLGAHDCSDIDSIMYHKPSESNFLRWDEKNDSLIREGIVSQITYGQAIPLPYF
jgi:hypothetical protein